jgi:protein-disulfide isomerase
MPAEDVVVKVWTDTMLHGKRIEKAGGKPVKGRFLVMKTFWTVLGLALWFCLLTVEPGMAAVQVEGIQTMRLPKAPLDVTTTMDGTKIFVLLKGGEVQLYSPAGELLESFSVSSDAERMVVSADGERLYVTAGQDVRVFEVATLNELPILNSPTKGDNNAPVTMTVFSDFQCPYCSRLVAFVDDVLAKNPGKVRVVFKQFPLRMHNFALPAALASLAAREQGKFWPMHDKLFANFNQLSDEKIRALAQEVGLDMARFDRDRNGQQLRDEVVRDQGLGQQAGVQGTPTVFINGKLLRERSLPGVQALIDREAGRAKRSAR